jgi:hypothetical protein
MDEVIVLFLVFYTRGKVYNFYTYGIRGTHMWNMQEVKKFTLLKKTE